MWRHLTFIFFFVLLFSPAGSASAAGHPNDMETGWAKNRRVELVKQ